MSAPTDYIAKAKEYRARAAECFRFAQSATAPQPREGFEFIAHSFLHMAEDMEFVDRWKRALADGSAIVWPAWLTPERAAHGGPRPPPQLGVCNVAPLCPQHEHRADRLTKSLMSGASAIGALCSGVWGYPADAVRTFVAPRWRLEGYR